MTEPVREAVRLRRRRACRSRSSPAPSAPRSSRSLEAAGIAGALRRRSSPPTTCTHGKPHPEGYLLRDRRGSASSSRPADVVAFEDTEAGVASAKDAGLRCLAVRGTLPDERLARADELVDAIDVALVAAHSSVGRAVLLAIDQGTTGTTCLVVDDEPRPVGRGYREIAQHFPAARAGSSTTRRRSGTSVLETAEEALAGCAGSRAARPHGDRDHEPARDDRRLGARVPAGRCTRRSSGRTGARPRAAPRCPPTLVARAHRARLRSVLLRDEARVDPARGRTCRRQRLAFGTIDSWLAWRLTGGAAHVTDVTNASRTMLLDLARRRSWDDELLDLFCDRRARCCPQSSPPPASSRRRRCSVRRVPLAGIAGDQQAALFGQGCFAPGEAKATYGTGTFVLANVGRGAGRPSPPGCCRRPPRSRPAAAPQFALEGSVLVGGAALQWLRDGLGLIATRGGERGARARGRLERGRLLRAGADGPRLAALGSRGARPDLRPHARHDAGAPRARRARGDRAPGRRHRRRPARSRPACCARTAARRANGFLMQLQADLLGMPGRGRAPTPRRPALGAAALAGLAVGIWPDVGGARRAACGRGARYEPHARRERGVERRARTGGEALRRATTARVTWVIAHRGRPRRGEGEHAARVRARDRARRRLRRVRRAGVERRRRSSSSTTSGLDRLTPARGPLRRATARRAPRARDPDARGGASS